MSEVTKTKQIIHSAKLTLTETEIAAFVVEGVKRKHPSLKDYTLTCGFDIGDDTVLSAVVEGERVS